MRSYNPPQLHAASAKEEKQSSNQMEEAIK